MKRKKAAYKAQSLSELIEDQQKALAAGRRGYAKADRLMDEIERQMLPSVGVTLGPRKVAYLHDKLANGSTQAFHPTYFRRYEIKILKA